jgi:hypothetical protein
MKVKNLIFMAMLAVVVSFSGGVVRAETNFEADVTAAINDGLNYLRNANAFTSTHSYYRQTRGLNLLALLEKRETFNGELNGYSGSSNGTVDTNDDNIVDGLDENDQALAQAAVKRILEDTSYGIPRSFNYHDAAYHYGQNLMALTYYARTGGPEVFNDYNNDSSNDYTLRSAINKLVDALVSSQLESGFWFYYYVNSSSGYYKDSSTTQFVVAGLAAAKGYYLDKGDNSPARLPGINAALEKCAGPPETDFGYANNETAGGGHAYRHEDCRDYGRWCATSYQQTASGLWCELLGGYTLNDSAVQNKLGWLYRMYNYESTLGAPGPSGWKNAFYYYLWSSSKAYTLIEVSPDTPTGSNLTTTSMGETGSGPVNPTWHKLHKTPANDARPSRRGTDGTGPGGNGYYDAEQQRWYYDYAYTLMTQQLSDGRFNNPLRTWGGVYLQADQAYALLILERALGGACVDTDSDGVCDDDDNCPGTANPLQEDYDLDGWGDACDECSELEAGDDPDDSRPGCPTNTPPVAVCDDIEVELGENGKATIIAENVDGGSYDSDDDEITFSIDHDGKFVCADACGDDIIVTLTVSDGQAENSCEATVTVVDKIAPTISCDASNIVPSDAPISFTATATDNCEDSATTVTIIASDCYKYNKAGKRVDKTESCVVSVVGDTITIVDSGGVGDIITWTVVATDACGNTSTKECEITVLHPVKGDDAGGSGSDANEGVGNGVDGNTNGHDNNGGNDDDGNTPGNPGAKGGKKIRG